LQAEEVEAAAVAGEALEAFFLEILKQHQTKPIPLW
jgi:hypothetical protein